MWIFQQKQILKEFVVMKDGGDVPTQIDIKDLSRWLLEGRVFLNEWCQTAETMKPQKLGLLELVWWMKRQQRLKLMEQGVQKELEKERHLSLLFDRKVTMGGFQMFLVKIKPTAELDAKRILQPVFKRLPRRINSW